MPTDTPFKNVKLKPAVNGFIVSYDKFGPRDGDTRFGSREFIGEIEIVFPLNEGAKAIQMVMDLANSELNLDFEGKGIVFASETNSSDEES